MLWFQKRRTGSGDESSEISWKRNHRESTPILGVVSTAIWKTETKKITISYKLTWATQRIKRKSKQGNVLSL